MVTADYEPILSPDSGDQTPQIPHGLPASLTRVLRWLDDRLDEPVQVESLALVAGVRPRTLEAHFRLYLKATPLGWVRRVRLARARQQLLAAGQDDSITTIAHANGFSQLGRFADRYRRCFGEYPSETLSAARAKSAGNTDGFVDEAMRLTWRALGSAFNVGPVACDAALAAAERAQELSPEEALPKAIAAWCWSQRAAHNFGRTPRIDRARALQLADQASRLGPHDALVLSLCSGALNSGPSPRRRGSAGRAVIGDRSMVAMGLGAARLAVGLFRR